MNEAEARQLAHEINQYSGWHAVAEPQPFLDRDNHDWWVITHYDVARAGAPRAHAIKSRQEWEAICAK